MRNSLIVAVLALGLTSGSAGAADIGIGAFGGISVPVVNQASNQGGQFGVRLPVNVIPLLTVEPFFAKSTLGDGEVDAGGFTYARDGGEVTAFGLNALFTLGTPVFKYYPYVGVGSYKIERDAAEEINKAGLNFGLGMGISPIPKISLSLRGEFVMVPTDETSQKFANVTVGVAYSPIGVP